MKIITTLIVAQSLLHFANAQSGSLDATFGNGGKIITSNGNISDELFAMDVQHDGKIVVAGSSDRAGNKDFKLVKYNDNGSLDQTFDSDGIVTSPIGLYDDIVNAVKIQSDGKIVAAGYSANYSRNAGISTYNFAVARYNADGSLDNTFGSNGKVITPIGITSSAAAIGIQQDGKIIVAGVSRGDFALARYNNNGTLDATFDNDGILTTSLTTGFTGSGGATALAIQKDGKIIAAGFGSNVNSSTGDLTMARYNIDGSLDSSFHENGTVSTDFGGVERVSSIALQNDGRIVLGGITYSGPRFEAMIARYNADGNLDSSFNSIGAAFPQFGTTTDFALGVAVQSDGKILLSGCSLNKSPTRSNDYDFAMARYTANGLLDSSFGIAGKVITAISPDQQSDCSYAIRLYANRIYLAGYCGNSQGISRFCVAAYQNDGLPQALILPLTLLNFSSNLQNKSVLCRWQTAREINTSHFIIQRSYDGVRFENIGSVSADGKVSNVYSFTDDLSTVTSQSSTIYYRLEMIDKDGLTAYSFVSNIRITQKSSFAISPNPAHTFVSIKGNRLRQIALFNEHGKLVLIKDIPGIDNYTLNIASLPSGVYVIKLKDNQENLQTEKLIVR